MKHQVSGNAFGSNYDITYLGHEIPNLKGRVDSFVKVFNASLSTYDTSSVISKINRNETDQMDSLNELIFRNGFDISRKSGGAFDMTIAPLTQAWGFGLKNAENMDSARVDSIMLYVGFRKFWVGKRQINKLDARIQFDYNAIAPGLAADMIGILLQSWGCSNYYVNVGGELICRGVNADSTDWNIGIEKPIENKTGKNDLQRIIGLSNKALATSGNYRKFYVKDGKKYAHTIDPRTGYPIQHTLLSATIIGPECVKADALATACMVLGMAEGKVLLEQHFPEYQFFFIYDDGKGHFMEEWSAGLKEKIKN